MRKNYPRYKQGELVGVYKKLSPKNKKILNDFLKECSITAGEKKVEKIRRCFLQFFDITKTDFDKINKEIVDSFLVLLNHSDRSMWSKNEVKVYLKKFILWYYKDYEMIANIKGDSRRGLNPQKITENNLITEEDVEKMLRIAEGYRDKALLFLSFETGARPQEILNLKWSDIAFKEDYADVTLYSNKTRNTRPFPVYKTKTFLLDWKNNYCFPKIQLKDFVFPNPRDRSKSMTSVGLNKIFRRLEKKAGLDKKIWNYLFRHSRATKLYEELPQPIVEKLMGHQNMAKIYAHISSKKAREMMLNKIYKVEKISPKDKEEVRRLKKEIEDLKNNWNWLLKVFGFEKVTEEDKKKLEKHYKKEMKRLG